MLLIACLHSSDANVGVFEETCRDLGLSNRVTLRHQVRADLLAAAEAAGGMTPAVAEATRAALNGLCDGADAVLLTCSTLGPALDGEAMPAQQVPMLRADGALAQEAVREGGHVVVLVTAESSLAPCQTLFAAAAVATGARVEVCLVPGAWAVLKAGDPDRYLALIAAEAERVAGPAVTAIALAQPSMAAAAKRTKPGLPILASPAAGLRAAVAAARG